MLFKRKKPPHLDYCGKKPEPNHPLLYKKVFLDKKGFEYVNGKVIEINERIIVIQHKIMTGLWQIFRIPRKWEKYFGRRKK